MLIDWFTIVAQAINFMILVWLMKRFLYKPILHAIDEREKRITKELADADTKRSEAEKERERFQKKNEDFDRHRDELLSKVNNEVKGERQRLLDEARRAADVLRIKRQDALKREQQSLNDEIIRRTRREVFAIARKTLTDLSGESLEEVISEVFIRRVRELNNETREDLAKALKTSSEPVLVRSAFELPSDQRTAIQRALNEAFSMEIQVRFESTPEVISGIELTSNGRKVSWTIADYLTSLEESIDELLKEQSKPEVQPEAKAEPKTESGTKSTALKDEK